MQKFSSSVFFKRSDRNGTWTTALTHRYPLLLSYGPTDRKVLSASSKYHLAFELGPCWQASRKIRTKSRTDGESDSPWSRHRHWARLSTRRCIMLIRKIHVILPVIFGQGVPTGTNMIANGAGLDGSVEPRHLLVPRPLTPSSR